MDVSIIVPVFNEEESITALYQTIHDAMDPLGLSYELLFVDDGSKDKTFLKSRELAAKDPCLKVIKFRKNYGQTPATAAGVDYARGRILITMDGDLQNDPADIPNFLAKIHEGYDIVVGWRHKRQDKLITRKIPSKIANWLIGKVTGVPIKDNGCSLKAYRAEIIKSVPLYSEMHRFIPAMLSLTGPKIAEIKVRHHARRFGESKYGLSRIYKVLFDLLTIKTLVSFSARPLFWFGFASLLNFTISLAAFIFILSEAAIHPEMPLVVPFSLSILFGASGIFLLTCGVLSELVYKTGDLKEDDFSRATTKLISTHEQHHGK